MTNITPELIQKYRANRAPRFTESYPGRAFHTGAQSALTQARYAVADNATESAWIEAGGECIPQYEASDYWEEGDARVRIVEHGDDHCSMDDLKGECYNPDVNSDINPNILKRQEREFESMVESDGVWGYVAQYWDGDSWEETDSIWGFAGDSFDESGYDGDLKQSALDALAAHVEAQAATVACEIMAARPDMHGAAA